MYADKPNKFLNTQGLMFMIKCRLLMWLSALTWICDGNPNQHGLNYEHNGGHTYDSQEYTEFWFYDIALALN
jgi:hypothetical protein